MNAIVFEGNQYPLSPETTVLDTLLDNGHDIPNGCRSGVCQSCLMIADDGVIPTQAQQGLSESQKKLNYFLSCQWTPDTAIKARKADSALSCDASVVSKTWLSDGVIQLIVKADISFDAGQFVTLSNSAGTARSYSIANTPNAQNHLEFHIKILQDGVFSQYVASELSIGETLKLQGPLGKCIYSASAEQPLLLAGMSTGMAPLLGIVREAIKQNHKGEIRVYIGSRKSDGFYLEKLWLALAARFSNIKPFFICLEGQNSYAVTGDIYKTIATDCPNLKDFQIYLCGNDSFVKKLRKQAFLAGAAMSNILADTFLPFAKK